MLAAEAVGLQDGSRDRGHFKDVSSRHGQSFYVEDERQGEGAEEPWSLGEEVRGQQKEFYSHRMRDGSRAVHSCHRASER